MPILYGTCPKCKTDYKLKGTCSRAGVLCPNCSEKGYTIVGVIHFEPKKPTLREAAEALLKHILENSVCNKSCGDDDDHSSLYRSDEFEIFIDELKEALK